MPGGHEQVRVPDDLRFPVYGDENEPGQEEPDQQPAMVELGPLIRSLLGLMLIVSGDVLLGVGMGLWLGLGAGMAAAGLFTGVVGVLLGLQD